MTDIRQMAVDPSPSCDFLEFFASPELPPTRSRTVLGRAEVNPNDQIANSSVIKTQLSRGLLRNG